MLSRIKDIYSLYDKGERVDINYNKYQNQEKLDIYQKSHLKRYEFVKQLLNQNDIIGDFACGTGYGTSMLSERSAKVIGIDINERVIKVIKKRYRKNNKIDFIVSNILNIKYKDYFNKIVSFETVEHLEEKDILLVFKLFFNALKTNGVIIFSVPYMQEASEAAIKMGFHKTFYIDEQKIKDWLEQAGFKKHSFKYQNYETHDIVDTLDKKDFIICIAEKTL
jgi:2-polyprenyl-3-methyl-5-hydroxy-6-metoxy-1,4-benzoquinol methylase